MEQNREITFLDNSLASSFVHELKRLGRGLGRLVDFIVRTGRHTVVNRIGGSSEDNS